MYALPNSYELAYYPEYYVFFMFHVMYLNPEK